MATSKVTPSIYVGTYHKYSNGSLAGEWVELDDFSSKDDFIEYIKELHADEEDPEFMFQDYEGIPENFISESSINADFWDYLDNTKDWDDTKHEAFKSFCDHYKPDTADAVEQFNESYQGEMSEEDFAYQHAEEMINPDKLMGEYSMYFDYDAYQRDIFINKFTEIDGYIFQDI